MVLPYNLCDHTVHFHSAMVAAKHGRLDFFRVFIYSVADMLALDASHNNCLHFAVMGGHAAVAKYIVERIRSANQLLGTKVKPAITTDPPGYSDANNGAACLTAAKVPIWQHKSKTEKIWTDFSPEHCRQLTDAYTSRVAKVLLTEGKARWEINLVKMKRKVTHTLGLSRHIVRCKSHSGGEEWPALVPRRRRSSLGFSMHRFTYRSLFDKRCLHCGHCKDECVGHKGTTALLQQIFSRNKYGLTPDAIAMKQGHVDLYKWLFEAELGFKALSAPPEYPNQDQTQTEAPNEEGSAVPARAAALVSHIQQKTITES